MTGTRWAVSLGLIISIIFVVWASGTLVLQGRVLSLAPERLAPGLNGLWAVQMTGLALLTPVISEQAGWRQSVLGLTIMIAVPCPLYALLWLAEAATFIALAQGIVMLMCAAAIFAGLFALLRARLSAPFPNLIVTATFQVICAIVGVIAVVRWPFEIGI